ncbi:restriction endonuclease subunit S [Pseudomonas yamanorum]|uniref:Restriction endonuclease subunit S n=1 Tax=Pseudomonas yamanorum TaxID=515393 RepID=A0A7Y8FH85_9PSED|nr:restriction endonuclease subunit S [Pseudomonas yamanorum]NWE79100.1 restriction endonuclease subunit S [Pseudomonas yamanorum]
MTAALLENLSLCLSATDGVSKLRELILELAVRGRLVGQDDAEESASEMLFRIAKYKEELVSAKKLKKGQLYSEVAKDEYPFELPHRWVWARLSDVCEIVGGGTPKSDDPECWDTDSGIAWITPADLYGLKGKYVGGGRRSLTVKGLAKSSARLVPPGTVLFSSRAPIGYVAIASKELATSQGFKSCVPFLAGLNDYIYWYLKRSAKSIDESASGTTFKEISGAGVAKILIPLPPLGEQQKIVAKIEELFLLCDQLELKKQKAEKLHVRLVKSSLASISEFLDADEINAGWSGVKSNLGLILSTESGVESLKSTILQLAVTGKLTRGNASYNVDSASSAVADQLFKLRSDWEWVRFDEVWQSSFYGPRFSKDDYVISGGTPTIRTTDMTAEGKVELKRPPLVMVPLQKVELYKLRPGDLLVTRSGSIGTVALFDLDVEAIASAYLIRIRLNENVDPRFALIYLRSPLGKSLLGSNSTSVGVPNVSAKTMSKFPFPLPPLSEQIEIVLRVEELMALCDGLKDRLVDLTRVKSNFLDAAVAQVIGDHSLSMKAPTLHSVNSGEDAMPSTRISRFMSSNPVKTVNDLVECLAELGGRSSPSQLLVAAGLGNDVEVFFDLLRSSRQQGALDVPSGKDSVIRSSVHED